MLSVSRPPLTDQEDIPELENGLRCWVPDVWMIPGASGDKMIGFRISRGRSATILLLITKPRSAFSASSNRAGMSRVPLKLATPTLITLSDLLLSRKPILAGGGHDCGRPVKIGRAGQVNERRLETLNNSSQDWYSRIARSTALINKGFWPLFTPSDPPEKKIDFRRAPQYS